MNQHPYDWLNCSLNTIHRATWHRSVKPISGRSGVEIELQGKKLINFASNNYLGLAGDINLIAAAITAIEKYGTGATGSRLLTGHRDIHQQLEQSIANLKQTEAALVFSSGYLANLGTISALVNQKDLILGDEYNHSSLKTGAKLSQAQTIDYQHCHIGDLKTKLQQHRDRYRRCLIITDSVFSMDGDLCPLPNILDLAETYNCMVLVDEAHATGVMGQTGAGCVEHFNCTGRKLIQIGTLSKALGSLGGYVAGDNNLIDFLKNRAASWIYTTGLSPADTAAALEAIAIIEDEPLRREKLWQNVRYLKKNLPQDRLLPSNSPIICLSLPDPVIALKAAQDLEDAGIFAPAIRPPTVPTSRLRFTIMATHQKHHLDRLIEAVSKLSHRLEIKS